MKKILYANLIGLICIACYGFTPPSGNTTVMVNGSNVLVSPTATQILNANSEIGKTSDITTLQTKTQNQTANSSGTTFSGTTNLNVLSTTGNTSVGGTLSATGATTLSSTLGVSGATSLGSTLGVSGATTLTGALTVNNNATFGTDTSSTGTFKGKIYMNSSELVATQTWSDNRFFQTKAFQLYFDTTPSINPYNYQGSGTRSITVSTPYYSDNGIRYPSTRIDGSAWPQIYSFHVPTTNFIFWTDVEFKVIRKSDGELVYWVSTQAGGSMGVDYFTHPARDPNVKIFYTVSGSPNNGRNWIQRTDNDALSNYDHANLYSGTTDVFFQIGGIVIQPNLSGNTIGGTPIITFFGSNGTNTPSDEYYYVYLRISPSLVERSMSGSPIWRPYNALSTATQGVR